MTLEIVAEVPNAVRVPAGNGDSTGETGTPSIRANPAKEYVSSGYRGWGGSYLSTLPSPSDTLLPELTQEIYERMLLDPQLEASVGILKMAVLAQGVTLAPPVLNTGTEEEPDPEYRQAMEISEFCTRALERMETPLAEALDEMMDALVYGYTVTEQVYEPVTEGPDAGKISLKALKVKEQNATAFRVDPFMNVVAIRNLTRTGDFARRNGAGAGAAEANAPEDLPREKFAVLTFRKKRGDPRGRSLLRAVYEWWYRKQGTLVEYDKYLAQFAGPSVIGYTSENAQAIPLYNADGTPMTDATGAQMTMAPEELMGTTLMAWRNGIAAAFPFGAKVDVHWPQGDGEAFIQLLDMADRQIALALLKQVLATLEGQHQARAASETHQDILGLVVLALKKWVGAMLRRDVLTPLVRYNFGDACLCMLPTVNLGETDEQDFAGDSRAMAGLGYRLDSSQFPEIDAMLGLPVRTESEDVLPEPEPAEENMDELTTEVQQPAPAPRSGSGDVRDDDGTGRTATRTRPRGRAMAPARRRKQGR